MTPESIELDELQLVPYRVPPMLVLTCATARDASYWRVAELTSRSEASFIRATGSRGPSLPSQTGKGLSKLGGGLAPQVIFCGFEQLDLS